jgi:hypothetical protein
LVATASEDRLNIHCHFAYPVERSQQFPASYPSREAVEAGGLMGYATNRADMYRQVGAYTDTVSASTPMAYSYGWRVTARCAAGKHDGMHRHKECVCRAEFDLETLVWTRRRAFPLSRLETRLRCPMCGSRDVVLLFTVPRSAMSARGGRHS